MAEVDTQSPPPLSKMCFATDSLVNSSSCDDFAALLDAELYSDSSDLSPDQDDADEDDSSDQRIKRRKVEEIASKNEEGSSSFALSMGNSDTATEESCPHPGSFGDLCTHCGKSVDDGVGVAFGYIHKDLRLGNEEILRLRNSDKDLLRHKKLCLVLDLDHTLLNSTKLEDLNVEEEYLKSQTDSLLDISKGSLFSLDRMHMMTKLRPSVRMFLHEASKMFEMYIYTMGEQAYALKMADLLDPKCLYFTSRVISKEHCTQIHQKGLDVVLGQESRILILDDTEDVWQGHKDNLILMERYHYFSSSCRQINCKSLSEMKSDEDEADGALATVLGVLQEIHSKFFDPENGVDYEARDVRQVLKSIRREVLKDCKIVFSRVFPTKFQASDHHLWKMADRLGATCSTELDSNVTHVVATDPGTEKSRWATQEGKFLVHPKWIEAANYFWRRHPEDNFPVDLPKNK